MRIKHKTFMRSFLKQNVPNADVQDKIVIWPDGLWDLFTSNNTRFVDSDRYPAWIYQTSEGYVRSLTDIGSDIIKYRQKEGLSLDKAVTRVIKDLESQAATHFTGDIRSDAVATMA